MAKRAEQAKDNTAIVPVAKVLPPISRSAEGLRDALFDELNLLREGQATTAHARALANLARLIIETARLEVQTLKEIKRAGESLRLGTGDGE